MPQSGGGKVAKEKGTEDRRITGRKKKSSPPDISLQYNGLQPNEKKGGGTGNRF